MLGNSAAAAATAVGLLLVLALLLLLPLHAETLACGCPWEGFKRWDQTLITCECYAPSPHKAGAWCALESALPGIVV
jgi:hypothetical protein